MPRVCASNNDPYDFCRQCFPDERKAKEILDNKGPGPDGRGNCFEYDAEHPDYGGEDYTCFFCRRRLTRQDNYPRKAEL